VTTLTYEDFATEYQPIVDGIAYEFGAKGHRYGADHDDFRQECQVWMWKNLSKMNAKRAEIDDPEKFGRWLARVLRNESMDYLVDIKDQAGGQPRQGAYFYSIAELKILLDSMFDPEKWQDPPQYESDRRSKSNPAHGGNWMTTLADVSRGYDQLKKEDRDLLAMFHRDGWRNKDLASAWDLSEAQMSWRHGRAVERLLEHLGGPKPEPMRADVPGDPFRGRHAISNAAARALTSASYEDD
jgi:DNA-directed RNA polymerase specialized sigma24 family protein